MRKQKLSLYILSFLFLLNVLALAAIAGSNDYLEVSFFDIGQGDSIFIETPDNHQILIDGGPNSAVLEKLGQEMPFWDRTIDLVILTHPDSDHISGLIEVLKNYEVGNILWTGVFKDSSEGRAWQEALKEEGAQERIAQAGQRIYFSKGYIEVLFPSESLEGKIFKDYNNTSIILKLKFGKNSFLFTGDADNLKKGLAGIDSDVLKVSHHGSKLSTNREFISEVSPQMAVISCGIKNRFGHPHQELLDILSDYGIKVLRTDIDGDVKVFSDGNNLRYSTANN